MLKQVQNDNEAKIAAQLVARIVAQDRGAEAEMVNRYQRGLLLMLKRRCNNDSQAQDIAQETWTIILRKVKRNELENPEKLASYIIQTGKNQLIMSFRANARYEYSPAEAMTHFIAAEPSPERALEDERIVATVRELIDSLPTARDRELLRRFYVQEQRKEIICSELQLDELHFNRVLYRARQRFKKIWQRKVSE